MHAVIQTDYSVIPQSVLAAGFVAGGLLQYDAKRLAKRSRGLLCELDEAKACAVAKHLVGAGYAVSTIPSEQLPDLPRAHDLLWFMTSSAGLAYPFGIRQEMRIVKWSGIFVVNSTTLHIASRSRDFEANPSNSARMMGSVAGLAASGVRSIKTKIVAKPTEVTDVVCISTDGAYQRLRFVNGLTGNRDLTRSAQNQVPVAKLSEYRSGIQLLVDNSKQAIVSEETRRMLDTRLQRTRPDKSAEWIRMDEKDFDTFNRWLLIMAIRELESQ